MPKMFRFRSASRSGPRSSLYAASLVAIVLCFLSGMPLAQAADTSGLTPEVAKLLPSDLAGSLHNTLPSGFKNKTTFVMATDATIGKPIAWISADLTLKGVAVDVADALGYVLGVKVHAVNTPFDDMIPSLQSGRADFSASDMLDTKKRETVVDFVDYLIDGSSILVASDSKLHDLTLAQMCGLTAGAIRGSVEEGYLEKQTAACKTEHKPALTVNVYQGNDAMLLALVSGRADVIMGASAQLAFIQQNSHGDAKQGGPPVGVAVDGITTLKGNGLATSIQQALQKLMDAGVYQKILLLYGMQPNGLPEATLNHASY